MVASALLRDSITAVSAPQGFRTPRSYVLVTPVKDEVGTIGRTINAVAGQTVIPLEWVIVSGGSTDGTDDLVSQAAAVHPWIRLVVIPADSQGRSFSTVVRNTERGVKALSCRDYGYIGLLDADVEFTPDYFETVIRQFESNPRLGLAGGNVIDKGTPRDSVPRNLQDVPGAVQFFRRDCFDTLGRLIAVPEGGWDALTCAVARMNGYETRLLTDIVVDHLKPRNISQGNVFWRNWQIGARDYALGYDPVFAFVKAAGRFFTPPFAIGAVAAWLGFCAAVSQRRPRVVPAPVLAHLRSEQRQRLRQQLTAPLRLVGLGSPR